MDLQGLGTYFILSGLPVQVVFVSVNGGSFVNIEYRGREVLVEAVPPSGWGLSSSLWTRTQRKSPTEIIASEQGVIARTFTLLGIEKAISVTPS
jgi:hypothetical protein